MGDRADHRWQWRWHEFRRHELLVGRYEFLFWRHELLVGLILGRSPSLVVVRRRLIKRSIVERGVFQRSFVQWWLQQWFDGRRQLGWRFDGRFARY
jgi:hypothetical protein